MSKQKKEQQKKRKKEQVRKQRLAKYRAELTATVGRDDGFLDHIFDLTSERDYETARGQLLAYIEKYPKYPRPYAELARVCAEMEDYPNMYWATEQLLQVGQHTFDDYLLHQSACVLNNMHAVLVACAEHMKRRFQYESDLDISVIRNETLDSFKKAADRVGGDWQPYTDEQLLELMRLHERSMLYLSLHRFEAAIRCCDEMTSRFSFYTSGYTNKVLAMMLDRGPDAAEPLLQQAFEKHPDAPFVLAFKIRQLALQGRHEELPAYCARLAATPSLSENDENYLIGKIEAFAWADDLDRVIETYQLAKKELEDDWDVDLSPYALATHYAAVAYARLGDCETAIRLWKLLPPNLIRIATENLEDIQKPVGERNGPWFFDFEHWVPFHVHFILQKSLVKKEVQDEERDEEEQEERLSRSLDSALKKMFAICPSFERVLIEMLKRGTPDCRTLVQMLFATAHNTPEFRAALLDFALGQSGTDEYRCALITSLSTSGWLESDTFKMWVKGEQHDIQFAGTEVYMEAKEPELPLSPAGREMHAEAQKLGNKGDFRGALRLLMELNDKEPGRPSILYNVAMFRKGLGDNDGCEEMIDKLLQDFPDYFFVQTILVQRLCKQRRLDEAWDILKSMRMMKRLHVSEYKAMTSAMIMYHLARGNRSLADSLRKNGIDIAGDVFPSLETYQNELDAG